MIFTLDMSGRDCGRYHLFRLSALPSGSSLCSTGLYLLAIVNCSILSPSKICKRFRSSLSGRISYRLVQWIGCMAGMLIYLFLLNRILLTMCNVSIINPGPRPISKPLTVFYNNVQGFINTRDLASVDPPLNMTKIHEFHGFLYTNKPDIVVLNETWLKKSINKNLNKI